MDFDDARRMALALPGADQGAWFGLPTFTVRSKFFAGLGKDGAARVLRCNVYERKCLMDSAPDVYFITDHDRDDPYVLVNLALVEADALRGRIQESWRMVAPKKRIAEREAGRTQA